MLETEKLKKEIIQYFSDYLEKKNHRKTPERFAILEEIYKYDGHFDIDELYLLMMKRGCKISKSTLYNNIELLLSCNLIRKNEFGKNTAKYEKSFLNRQHDHLINIETGEVHEFCDPRVQTIKNSLAELFGMEIMHHSLNVYARNIKNNKIK